MKKVQKEVLVEKTAEEQIDDLNNCRYSILNSLGCRRLRLEMFLPGLVSSLIVRFITRRAKRKLGDGWRRSVRRQLVKLFDWGAPYELEGGMIINNFGLVIGFNHPSLGEILRLVGLVSKYYPNDVYLFPVNLPWYEALCPVLDKMEEAGFYLTPIVTPSTRQKIEQVAGKDALKIANQIGAGFNSVYLKKCNKILEQRGVVLVAPSATRQETIFRTDEELERLKRIEPQTMSLLAMNLTKSKVIKDVVFLPLAVRPRKDHTRGLNLFTKYKFRAGRGFLQDEAIMLSKMKLNEIGGGRKFDYEFLSRIALSMFNIGRYDMIAPFNSDKSLQALAEIIETSKIGR
ncbi:hypothetical protein J6W91_00425 [Candidatus Saccharibacteria bacterium]|nr:hypothetical protein [Candidatus Saccharibacteria bacterium]